MKKIPQKPDKQPIALHNFDRCTPRELDVAKLICQALTDIEIGVALSLSHNTVNNHRIRLYQKTDSHSAVEFVVKALQARIVLLDALTYP